MCTAHHCATSAHTLAVCTFFSLLYYQAIHRPPPAPRWFIRHAPTPNICTLGRTPDSPPPDCLPHSLSPPLPLSLPPPPPTPSFPHNRSLPAVLSPPFPSRLFSHPFTPAGTPPYRGQQGQLLVVYLLELMCDLYAREPAHSKRLFTRIFSQLARIGVGSRVCSMLSASLCPPAHSCRLGRPYFLPPGTGYGAHLD